MRLTFMRIISVKCLLSPLLSKITLHKHITRVIRGTGKRIDTVGGSGFSTQRIDKSLLSALQFVTEPSRDFALIEREYPNPANRNMRKVEIRTQELRVKKVATRLEKYL